MVRRNKADEHRRETCDEEAQRDRQQHPLEPLLRADFVSGHYSPKAVSQPAAAAAAAPGAVATAVVCVADGGRLINCPAIRHIFARDVRNFSDCTAAGRLCEKAGSSGGRFVIRFRAWSSYQANEQSYNLIM